MKRRTFGLALVATLSSGCMRLGTDVLAETPCTSSVGTLIRAQNANGAPLYHLEGMTLRDTSPCGARLYYFDGTRLRHRDATGASIYHFDGKLVRAVNPSGARVLFKDGQTWRAFGTSGAALFHFDGVRLRHRDGGGAIIALFGKPSPDWSALAVLEAQRLLPL